MKKDDELSPRQRGRIRKHAERLLHEASAFGRYPTPVDDLVSAAKLRIDRDTPLDSSLLGRLRQDLRNTGEIAMGRVKRALQKLQGLFFGPDDAIFLDPDLHPKRRLFVSLHEVGHGYMPHQRRTYSLVEDSDAELDPDTRETFEAEANAFASDVLFQLDNFDRDVADSEVSLKTIINLARRYGPSVYSTGRRFVQSTGKECALIVFEQPVERDGQRFLQLRRALPSSSFTKRFGPPVTDEVFGPDSFFVRNLPWKTFTGYRPFPMQTLRGEQEQLVAEAFDSTHNVFFLLRSDR